MIHQETNTVKFKVPSGVELELKAKLTRGDTQEINLKALGDIEVSEDTKPKFMLSNSYELINQTLLVVIKDWDVTELDGSKTPITLKNINDVLTDDDVTAIMQKVKQEPDPKS